jgi:murein hydrolase activator
LMKQEKQYGQLAQTVKQLQERISKLRHSVSAIGQEITETRRAIDKQKKGLENQVQSAYAMGSKERLKVIFNQQDPALSGRMLVYYDYLNKARLQKLRDIEENLLALKRLEDSKHQETEALNQTLQQRVDEQNALKSVRNEREKLLTTLDQRYSNKQLQLQQLKSDEKELRQLIAKLQRQTDDFHFHEAPAKPFAKLKGQLPWPLSGKLEKKFGSSRSESRWDGVLIGAKEGSPIHAVTHGRIVYADWLRGYGLLTIIDHGKGYMTLYAFNQSLYKAEGDWVEAGDVVASVGSSGGRSQPALYFGIRKKGKPVNPVKWCRKISKGKVG